MRRLFPTLIVIAAAVLASACHGHRVAATATPPSPPAMIKRQIQNAVDAGDGDVIVRNLRRAILEQPDRLDLRLELVEHFEGLGQTELVVEHLRLLAERYPANEELMLRLARGLRGVDARDEALRILRNLTARQNVDSPAVWSLAGILLDELDRPMEGEAEHRKALALAKDDIDVYENNLGYNLLTQGRHEEAIAMLESALMRRPRSETARNNLAAALAARKEIDKTAVLTHWKSVTDPASAHNNLAAAMIEQGRYTEARDELAESLKLKSDLPAAWKNLQLLSELDGKPVTLARPAPAAAQPSGWQKMWHGVRKTFVTDEQVLKPKGSTQRASR